MRPDLNLAELNKEFSKDILSKVYANLLVNEIRKKYSVNDELAILRQRDTKPKEFAEYDAYVESCKILVKDNLASEGYYV